MGEYDEYIVLAERYGWTQEEIDEMDPVFYTELVAYINAEGVIKRKYKPKKGRHQWLVKQLLS